jgi:hypothetical protein
MELKNLEKYLRCLEKIKGCAENGQLISLEEIYSNYGRPKNLSPRRVLGNRRYRGLIMYEIEQSGYEVEKVICFTKTDVMANWKIASVYLHGIDEKDYVVSLFNLELKYGGKNLINGLNNF